MRQSIAALIFTASALLVAGSAVAQQPLQPATTRVEEPGMAALTAAANVVYAPVRLVVTVINAGFGAVTGLLTLNDVRAADDVFAIASGPGFLQPDMLAGRRAVEAGELRYTLRAAGQ